MVASRTHQPDSDQLEATRTPKNQEKLLEISWLALETGHPPAAYASRINSSAEELLKGNTADLVIVDGSDAAVVDTMETLRRHPNYAERLIFLGRASNEHAEALADGYAPTEIAPIIEQWTAWNSQRKKLPPRNSSSDPLWPVDRWLFLRPETWIKPLRSPTQRHLYSYPIVNALLNKPDLDGLTLLEKRWRQGHYERGALTDRIRSCRECNSAHLNYIDLCSQCRSIEIARQPSLHCFICGHVDRQEKFRNKEGLNCPNCLTTLRHIGTDYDRPAENYQCQACHGLFIDAAVEARCLHCGHRHETDELRIREIRPFRLSEARRLQWHNASATDTEAKEQNTGDARILSRDKFADLVNWQLSVFAASKDSPAYKTLCPALLAVKLIPRFETEDHLDLIEKMDRWMHALVQVLTIGERAQREHHDLLWILRPHCRNNDIQTFHHYLQRHLQTEFDQEKDSPSLLVNGCLLNQTIPSNQDAELIQARLLSELQENSIEHDDH